MYAITTAGMEPLRVLEAELMRLVERPRPLTLVVGDLAAGLPEHPMDMAELRALLLHPSVGYQARGLVWVRLVKATGWSGRRGKEWRTAVCAMALPGLWRTAARLRRSAPDVSQHDVQQALLAGFWEALVDLRDRVDGVEEPGRIPASLCWAADRAARVSGQRFPPLLSLTLSGILVSAESSAQGAPGLRAGNLVPVEVVLEGSRLAGRGDFLSR